MPSKDLVSLQSPLNCFCLQVTIQMHYLGFRAGVMNSRLLGLVPCWFFRHPALHAAENLVQVCFANKMQQWVTSWKHVGHWPQCSESDTCDLPPSVHLPIKKPHLHLSTILRSNVKQNKVHQHFPLYCHRFCFTLQRSKSTVSGHLDHFYLEMMGINLLIEQVA